MQGGSESNGALHAHPYALQTLADREPSWLIPTQPCAAQQRAHCLLAAHPPAVNNEVVACSLATASRVNNEAVACSLSTTPAVKNEVVACSLSTSPAVNNKVVACSLSTSPAVNNEVVACSLPTPRRSTTRWLLARCPRPGGQQRGGCLLAAHPPEPPLCKHWYLHKSRLWLNYAGSTA
jgi:hypothetical protein